MTMHWAEDGNGDRHWCNPNHTSAGDPLGARGVSGGPYAVSKTVERGGVEPGDISVMPPHPLGVAQISHRAACAARCAPTRASGAGVRGFAVSAHPPRSRCWAARRDCAAGRSRSPCRTAGCRPDLAHVTTRGTAAPRGRDSPHPATTTAPSHRARVRLRPGPCRVPRDRGRRSA
jgi:hypothetical protein